MIFLAVRYPITLNVREPNNNIGLLKIRQADEETQTLVVQILEDALPKSYVGLQAFFCARIGQTPGLGIIEQKLNDAEMTDPENGKLVYTFRAEDWQVLGRQNGYFSFRKMNNDHEYVQQFSTRDFTYEITKNIFSDGIKEVKTDGSTYVWTFEDLLRLFKDFISQGENQMLDFESQWQAFVEANKEVLESIDPGGTLLKEIIESRESAEGTTFPTLGERLNDADRQIGELTKLKNGSKKDTILKSLEGGMHQYLIDFYEAHKDDFLNDGSVKINLINDLHAQKSVYPKPAKDHGESATLGFQYLLMHGMFSKHVDFSIVNGDQIHGREPIAICSERNKRVKEICDLFDTTVYYNLGNHEDGNCYKAPKTKENLITKQELLDIYKISSFNQSVIMEDQKLKILVVSVYDNPETFIDGVNVYPRDQYSVISDETFDFVKTELESTPDDYVVLTFVHNIIASNDSDYSVNHEALKKLFENFNNSSKETIKSGSLYFPINATVDFTGRKENRFVGMIGGHRHKDEYDNSRGWHDITRTCQVCSDPVGTSEPIRILGTESELITDIVNIDTANRRLFIQRFGFDESLDLKY